MNYYSHIIWDWNGTLLDDVNLCISIVNRMLKKRSLNEFNGLEDYQKAFCFPVIDYYKKAGFDFNKESFEDLAEEYMEQYNSRDKEDCTLHNYAEDVVNKISKSGMKQVILSASKKSNLMKQVEYFGIQNYFNDILGISDIYAGSKIDIGMDYISKEKIKKAVLIGDTVHDYETAKALGADCILIAKGHQNKNILSSCKAQMLEDIREVPAFLLLK